MKSAFLDQANVIPAYACNRNTWNWLFSSVPYLYTCCTCVSRTATLHTNLTTFHFIHLGLRLAMTMWNHFFWCSETVARKTTEQGQSTVQSSYRVVRIFGSRSDTLLFAWHCCLVHCQALETTKSSVLLLLSRAERMCIHHGARSQSHTVFALTGL